MATTTVSNDEIDEAVAQLMEHAGVTDRGNGWTWREQRDYANEIECIVRAMLAGEFKEEESQRSNEP